MTINIFNIKYNIKKEHMIIAIIFIAIALLLIIYASINKNNELIIDTEQDQEQIGTEVKRDFQNVSEQNYNEETQKTENAKEIKVYVIGCVNNPGIIALSEGQLIYDAIEAAGGATEDADLQSINMVYPLEQNVMINILPKNADKTIIDNQAASADSAGSGIQIIKDTGEAVMQIKGNNTVSEKDIGNSKGKININKANINELDTLPGIGEATASDIIKYRENNGAFQKIEDIMKVPRIKEKRFKQIEDFITID